MFARCVFRMTDKKNLSLALLFLRGTIFVVMLTWTIDKFVRPEHATKIFESFYFIPGVGHSAVLILGGLELLLLLIFVLGVAKRMTYGLVLLLHAGSTLSSFKIYAAPFTGGNILFFAAWPMLAACFALYLLRDDDTLLALT